jgi:hypothetical protein
LSKNDTKSLRGSSASMSALNETDAAAIQSMFHRKRFVVKSMNSTALTVYKYKRMRSHRRRHATNGTCPLTRTYTPSLYMCFPNENLLEVPTVNYPLVKWRPKINAHRFSSFKISRTIRKV